MPTFTPEQIAAELQMTRRGTPLARGGKTSGTQIRKQMAD